MNQQDFLRRAVKLYDAGWRLLMPVLRLSPQLKDGYRARRLPSGLPRAELWIQAASGGEAYLAWSLIRELKPERNLRVLVTTNTRQGMDILEEGRTDISAACPEITLFLGWCPFDRPKIMQQAICRINPGLVVLLETEIWPGMLYALKIRKHPVCIVNGRITQKSLSGYKRIKNLLYMLRPDEILAVSKKDAAGFAGLFGKDIVSVMPNMKFDRLCPETQHAQDTVLPEGLKTQAKFLILASIRKQEEKQVKKLIKHVQLHHPDAIIGLFPRHMHRLDFWKHALTKMGTSWQLRSKLSAMPGPGRIILWDRFGELASAYKTADAVFVGGSLAPVGGQNFLEPLIHGLRPVTGPYWENFFWAGKEIFANGLVIKENNWRAAARQVCRQLENPAEKKKIRKKAVNYITARQGGTKTGCRVIEKYLKTGSAKEAL